MREFTALADFLADCPPSECATWCRCCGSRGGDQRNLF